jgi:DNA repair exonuclease SbcCD ATPase subunit
MPFCTECGARHDDSAKVCPSCGQPIFQPPDDEELDDVLASIDDFGVEALREPRQGDPSPDYVEQIQEVRSAIAAQSTALQELDELTWENSTATQIRDELTVALAQLRELTPPHELDVAHEDFVQGAEHLVHGFVSLVDAINQPGADAAVDEAQEEIAQATERFRRGADQLNDYLAAHEAAMTVAPEDFPDLEDELDLPAAEKAEDEEDELDLDALLAPETAADAPPAAEVDLDDLEAELGAAEEELEEDEAEEEEEIPPLPDDLAALEDLPEPSTAPALPSFGAPAMPAMTEPIGDAPRGAWPTLGDPGTDSLMLEIEGGWVRGRPGVYEAIERAIRAAVADALRGALNTRLRVEEEARINLQRLAGERNRLQDEVESLRRETLQLQAEAAEMRRTLNELERERQAAQDRRQHMFQEAEQHRAQLLGEIEQLGGQLDAMRRNIVSLLNMSATSTSELASKPVGAEPESEAPAQP